MIYFLRFFLQRRYFKSNTKQVYYSRSCDKKTTLPQRKKRKKKIHYSTRQDSNIHALGLEAGACVDEIVRDVDVALADHVHHLEIEATEHARECEVELGVSQIHARAHAGALTERDEVALQSLFIVVGQPAVRVEDGWRRVDGWVIVD